MKKGYWVDAYRSISDESATKAYAELAVPAIASFGGRFLARTSIKVHPHEAALAATDCHRRIRQLRNCAGRLRERGIQKGAAGTRLGRRTRFPYRGRGVG